MNLRQLVRLAQSRQADQWAHTLALCATVGNLFAARQDRFNVRRLLPAHLRSARPAAPELTPAEIRANCQVLKQLFRRRAVRQRLG